MQSESENTFFSVFVQGFDIEILVLLFLLCVLVVFLVFEF